MASPHCQLLLIVNLVNENALNLSASELFLFYFQKFTGSAHVPLRIERHLFEEGNMPN